MHADAFLAAAERLPVADLDALIDGKGLVVVAPHPDDESLGCGGIIAEARARGRDVRIVIVSDGCGSHTHSALYPPEKLRDLRETELVDAAGILGVPAEAVTFLRLPDAGVPSTGPVAEDAAERIAAIAQDADAGAVCVTWGHDPHCDHQASAALVRLARPALGPIRIFAYPVWGWTLPEGTEVGPGPTGFRVDVTVHRAAKTAAIGAHRSQTTDLIADDPTGFRLEPEMIARFTGPYEIFVAMDGLTP
ncbi:GlcNAc-PI de-N-acetylase [Methylobacterium sp. Leaf113]|uniref:PIG-L deacetylase family protein n=1 Tax=Methylobacterium sp. Leaf113 TaxID=1736259 RepID=UPI0006FEF938|nr:PIG-L deacetylase family protein [Methylobacterium sp. Leaf113]KQP85387.1 GlcNAc-PI de-N-acetylase [Methylobacterium sp. Leaf113]